MNEQPQQPVLPPSKPPEEANFYQPGQNPQAPFTGPGGAANSPSSLPAARPSAPKQPAPADNSLFSWEASEYIHHTKGVGWFAGFGLVVVALLGIAYLTGAWTFILLIVVMAVAMVVFALRPPRVLHYSLTNTGVQIEQTFYRFADFRAFGVLAQGAFYSIMLVPVKRFMPAINLYFTEQDGEKIVDIIGSELPMEELNPDLLDKLMRRLRF